jgi:feruloyl esterase
MTITSAAEVAAGALTLPASAGVPAAQAQAFSTLPPFCRVTAMSRPSADSEIALEVWMPLANWNMRFQPVGNGLWGGSLNFQGLAAMLRAGYATASNDTGHRGAGASFAIGHPQKLIDFGYRAFHEMTLLAKASIAAFYGTPPTLSLVDQCGGAGRGVLAEIQRYRDSYDLVAASGLDTESTRHAMGQLWVWQAAHKTSESAIPVSKLPLLHDAALKSCDARDGIADGVIADPLHCKVDPAVLQCKAGDAADCLTAAQVETARTIYSPVVNPRTRQTLFGPLLPGGELAWGQQTGPEPFGYGTDLFRYLVMKDPMWHPRSRPVDFDRDAALADSRQNQVVNVEPNLNAFVDRGGKLLFVGGWADGAIAPASNTDFYEGVVRNAGQKRADSSVRLFMVPDMGHCPAAPNAENGYIVDTGGIIEAWYKSGRAPDSITVRRRVNGVHERELLVCKYPQVAFYRGNGDPKAASSFVCRNP